MKVEELETKMSDEFIQTMMNRYHDQQREITKDNVECGKAYDEIIAAVEKYCDKYGKLRFRDGFECAIMLMEGDIKE